jgi:Zn finger protein HypA/HybF involved in hydrogenase expression
LGSGNFLADGELSALSGGETMRDIVAMQDMVQTILDTMQRAGGYRVINVQLVVGASRHLSAEVVYQYFEKLTVDTPIEKASLTILWLPVKFQCVACQHRFERSESIAQTICPNCGSIELAMEQQDVCYVSAIDVDYDDVSWQFAATREAAMGEMQRVHIIGR